MFFKDIPGKDDIKSKLIDSVDQDMIPHAQMLLGRSGSGHLPLALALASYILCTDRQKNDSCGVCPACVKSHKYIHPDMHFAYPVVKKDGLKREETISNSWLPTWRAALGETPFMDIVRWQSTMGSENSQPNINKRECEDIIHKLSMKAFQSTYKLMIIWMPEYLKKEGNRLLKLIEEPAPDTVIIMVADNQEEILNTIISRVQIVKVPPYHPKEIAAALALDSAMSDEAAWQVSVMAEGDLGKAYDIAHGQNADYSEILFQWIRTAYKMEPVALRSMIDEISRWGREGQKNFIQYGLHFFREYLFWIVSGSENIKLSPNERKTAANMQKIFGADKVEKTIAVLDGMYKSIVRNANPKIVFMSESLNLALVMRGIGEHKGLYVD